MGAFAKITPGQLKQLIERYSENIINNVYTKDKDGKYVKYSDAKSKHGIYIGHGYIPASMKPIKESDTKYKITEAIIFKNKYEVTFICGMVVQGPKGGKYLLDEFCSEIWLKENISEYGVTLQNYLMAALYDRKVGTCLVELDKSNNFVTTEDYRRYTTFRRKDGLDRLRKSGIMNKIQEL